MYYTPRRPSSRPHLKSAFAFSSLSGTHLNSQRCSLLSCPIPPVQRNEKDDSLAYSVRMTILLLLLEHQLSKEDPEEKTHIEMSRAALDFCLLSVNYFFPPTARLLCINT